MRLSKEEKRNKELIFRAMDRGDGQLQPGNDILPNTTLIGDCPVKNYLYFEAREEGKGWYARYDPDLLDFNIIDLLIKEAYSLFAIEISKKNKRQEYSVDARKFETAKLYRVSDNLKGAIRNTETKDLQL